MSFSPVVMRIAQKILSPAYTLFLFTKSDTILVVAPMLTVAMALAGPTDWSSFLMALVWLELHLLAFNIKNQIYGFEEDKLCKPDRPFPSGRISLERGESLYRLVIAMCIVVSVYNRLTGVSLVFMLAMWLNNEAGWSVHPVPKSLLCSIGYMCFCWGTTYIVGRHQPLNDTSMNAMFSSGLTLTLTIHAQDFRDRSGDAAVGRRTIPLILPQGIARWSLLLLIWATTYGLVLFWHPPMLAVAIFAFLGITTTVKFVVDHSEEADRKSFRWYELWLICGHILPIFERMSRGEISSPFSLLSVPSFTV